MKRIVSVLGCCLAVSIGCADEHNDDDDGVCQVPSGTYLLDMKVKSKSGECDELGKSFQQLITYSGDQNSLVDPGCVGPVKRSLDDGCGFDVAETCNKGLVRTNFIIKINDVKRLTGTQMSEGIGFACRVIYEFTATLQ